jgi:hypothetical protein
MDTQILAPAAALVGWSLIMLFWVIATRFPAFAEANLDLSQAAPGTRYGDVESALPASVNWKSHNFVHLMEQPTLFYATIAILAIAGQGTELNLMLAWGYVGLRVVHSLWQSLVNTIPVRVTLFAVSTLCLTGLAVNAIRATIF